MSKFFSILLTVTGGLLLMFSVSFANNDVVEKVNDAVNIINDPLRVFNDHETLPLGDKGYDSIFTDNRVLQVVGHPGKQDTGFSVRRLFVYDAPDGSIRPSVLVIIANIIIGAVAILYLALAAVNFIIARGDEEALNKVKDSLGYVIIGLFMVAAANIVAFSIFTPETRNFLTGSEVPDGFYELIMQAKVFIQYIIFGVAVLALMLSGYELITRMGSDESVNKEKQFVKHFLLAAGLIAFAEILVRGVFYARNASGVDTSTAAQIGIIEIVGLVNFLLGLVAAAATFMLILASLYYVLSFGDEDRTGRAKRIIIGCIVGIVLALSAYTIVAYFIGFSTPYTS